MSETDPRRDPRFRSFRAAAYGLHITLVTIFCLFILVSVLRSVRRMTPDRLPPAEQVLTWRECLEGAQTLWQQLEGAQERLVRSATQARTVDEQWMEFRTGWLRQLREREAQCALGSRERADLRAVFSRLERVQELYTIHSVQYANEVGGAVDSLRSALETARSNPAAGRLP